ncbi:MAG TPA: M20 family metallopeptidase [Rubrobacteraceae bacterium]|nr:M20 family metallopeptidase [Rubrobacteraceae bacterium]
MEKSAPYMEEIVSLRRHLHQHPELSGEERATSRTVQQKLEERGIPFTTGYAGTGVLGLIEGGKPGGTVALRADIDALPIHEENGHDFVSKNEGVMHACGHDAHTAMLVGAAWLLNESKEELPGRVLLVFQPAEEASPTGGARPMMKDGVFREHRPDVIFAQHVWPELPVGRIGVRRGAMTGASDRFKVTIEGVGGHASKPHQTTDAIVVANQVINALQTVVSREVNPLESAVLTIGKIRGGTRYNAIADRVTLEGTVRTFRPETKETVKDRFHSIVTGVTEAMGATARIQYRDGYPAAINDPVWAERVAETARDLLGDDATPEIEPSLGGEDFGRFLLKYPGAYFRLGTARSDDREKKRLHDSRFDIEESALQIGVELLARIAADSLCQLESR